MSSLINSEGDFIPVTIVYVPDNIIAQVKTSVSDGYDAIQCSCRHPHYSKGSCTNAEIGHLKKWNCLKENNVVKEFRTVNPSLYKPGQIINIHSLADVTWVNVTSISKGKGFSGVIRRHGFAIQGATHGNSLAHRAHGSTGCRQDPGRVFKGKKMAGRLGNKTVTMYLKIIYVDFDNKLLAIKGGVPGPSGALLCIKPGMRKL
jgi:large subunit ribosomal protein L3